ncbi:(2Fe-2S) ferredoxin domain-containing protein [Hufsiella ginkgonis]|uniref:(2Fe-2S) ferredoxin domain-containing protein n=1 Tax=Hufsiella ginkgonis TaxID=2695274 RepID=A0A7K1XW10_9SPHI|nr:(2Fe-2S) ferredoxin domain-containing protein [Hufsiella ginkgonis]MXV15017.1 (2Fe-2S) ferredoxin domain-containing protein [Hufsiella ginkgonis]
MSKFEIPERVIFVCTGSKCEKRGSKYLYKSLKAYLKQKGMRDKLEVMEVDCTDRCKFAPVLTIQPDNIWLNEYTEKQVFKQVERLEQD